MNVNDLILMDPSHYEETKYVSMSTKPAEGDNDWQKGQLKLDPSIIIYFKPFNLKAKEGINRTSPFITNWMHRIPIGEENGRTKYKRVVCPRTEIGVKGASKVCKFCGHNSKLWNDKEAGDKIAAVQYDALKSRFYGYLPGLVVGIRDVKTKQMLPDHPEMNKVRTLYISKKSYNEDILPKLEGDVMTAIGYQAVFGNPGRLLVISSTKSDYGVDAKIAFSEQNQTIKMPDDIVQQINDLDFDKNFKRSSREEIEEAFQKYVVNGEMKISGISSMPATQVIQGGLAAALNTNLAQPQNTPQAAPSIIPQIEMPQPVPQMEVPMATIDPMPTVASPATPSGSTSLEERIAARKAARAKQ